MSTSIPANFVLGHQYHQPNHNDLRVVDIQGNLVTFSMLKRSGAHDHFITLADDDASIAAYQEVDPKTYTVYRYAPGIKIYRLMTQILVTKGFKKVMDSVVIIAAPTPVIKGGNNCYSIQDAANSAAPVSIIYQSELESNINYYPTDLPLPGSVPAAISA